MSEQDKAGTALRQQQIPIDMSDDDTAEWIWRNLVPVQGQSAFVQGELIRSIGRLSWEARNNGNDNWDKDFAMFVSYLREHLGKAECFTAADLHSLHKDLDRLLNFRDPYYAADLYCRVSSFVVKYCRAQPEFIPRQHDPDQSR